MIQEDEIKSSTLEPTEREGALISFIGFRRHLCEGFIETVKPEFNVKAIYLFESEYSSFMQNVEKIDEYESSINSFKKRCISRFPDARVFDIPIKFIWSMSDIFPLMKKIKERNAIINISAGPSPFIAVSIFWSLKMKTVRLAHVVEFRDKNNMVESFSFKVFNPIPFLHYYFELDELDRKILHFIGGGLSRTRAILDSLNKTGSPRDRITLKTVENRINKLEGLGLVEKFPGKSNIINMCDDIFTIAGSTLNLEF